MAKRKTVKHSDLKHGVTLFAAQVLPNSEGGYSASTSEFFVVGRTVRRASPLNDEVWETPYYFWVAPVHETFVGAFVMGLGLGIGATLLAQWLLNHVQVLVH